MRDGEQWLESIEEWMREWLPDELKKHYDAVELMHILSSDTKHMIFPYKIEVK